METLQNLSASKGSQLVDTSQMLHVLLAEDNEVVRIGLRTVLNQTSNIQIIGEAGTIAEMRTLLAQSKPEVILMGIRLPDGNGVDACRSILSECPDTRVVFLSSVEDQHSMFEAVVAGASGFLSKDINPSRLIQAIEMVADGHSILAHRVVSSVKNWIKRRECYVDDDQKTWGLSPQQQKVLSLVAEGKTNKEIATILNLSERTVRNYLGIIFEKLGISRRTQAATFFVKQLAS